VTEAAAIGSRRGLYDVRAAAVADTRQWQSQGSTAWTVVMKLNRVSSFPAEPVYLCQSRSQPKRKQSRRRPVRGSNFYCGLAASGEER